MRGLIFKLLFVSFVLCAAMSPVRAAEPAVAAPEKFCLGLIQIDNINIMDNQNIVFKTKSGEYYLNHLPRACSRLSRNNAIMYRTSLNQLCSLDIITVLDNIGGGFEQAGSCGLGKFKPISKVEYEALRKPSAEK